MSIGRKFITWTVSVIFIFGLLTAYIYYRMEMQEERERIEAFAGNIAPLIEESLANYMITEDISILDKTMNTLKRIKPISTLWVINREGIIKASTDEKEVGTRLLPDDPACGSCHRNKGQKGFMPEGQRVLRWARPVSNMPQCHKCHDPRIKYNGIIITDISLEESERHIKKEIMTGLLIIFPSLLAVGFALFFLSKKVVIERLDRVAETLKRFREGDYNARIQLEGRDEITELENSFNEMAGAINNKEQELKKSEAGLLEAQRIAGMGNWEWDIVKNKLKWSNEIYRIFGLLPECGTSHEAFLDSVHPDDVESVKKSLNEALAGRKPYSIDHRIVLPDGTERIVHEQAEVFFDETGKPIRMHGTVQDITERKTAEEEIHRHDETMSAVNTLLGISLQNFTLERILEQALDLILSIPWLSLESRGAIFLVEDGQDRLVMKAQRGLSEYVQKECIAVPFGKCLCGRAASTHELQFAADLDERHEIRYQGITPHGHYCVPIRLSGRTLGVVSMHLKEGHRSDKKEVDFLHAIANALAGIIQRKGMEQEREKNILELQDLLFKVSLSKKKWQETFDAITDMIVILDRNYRIVRANRAVTEYFGLQIKDVLNKSCHEIFHSLHTPIKGCPFKPAMDSHQSLSCDVSDYINRKTFHVSVFPYFSPDGEIEGMVHIARDVTTERENEMRLIMSERLASLGQMAAGIAHEINNPLAAIAGCAEGLLNRVQKKRFDPELFENYLKIIEEEILRCKSITTGMLSFVRKPTYDIKAVDVHDLLEKTVEIIGFQGRLREVEVIRRFKEGMPLIRGSEGELRQVFLAIITNALDVMEDRGKLTLETGIEHKGIFVEISDTGPGISPEHITRVLEPFFTTKGEKGGTGLGLSIANKIVSNHGGSIIVFSESGQGTTFRINLPA